jgi:hypothetical protein
MSEKTEDGIVEFTDELSDEVLDRTEDMKSAMTGAMTYMCRVGVVESPGPVNEG